MGKEIGIAWVRSLLKERPRSAHKGTFGHVFIIAGSRGFTGAAKLACMAAERSGVGLVTVGVAQPLRDVVATALTDTMSLVLPSTDFETLGADAVGPALEFAATKQAVVLGPGLSQHSVTRAFVVAFVRQCAAPLLIDADGLNALAANPEVLLGACVPRVLTPHPGEMARIAGRAVAEIQADRESAARDLAARYRCVVVLKGHRTVIADALGEVLVNPTGNAGLAKGGTGDVLSGLIGGLMAQQMSPLHAAALGVYLHGLAGDIAASAKTQRGMTASDVVACLPDAWRAIERES